RRAPWPAISAHLARVEEIIERHETPGESVLVGRNCGTEESEVRFAIATPQISQDLIVGSVFLDDVDHVTDPPPQRGHQSLVFRVRVFAKSIVGSNGCG